MDSGIVPLCKCSRCGGEYPATLEYFPPRKNGKYGLRKVCIPCYREQNAARMRMKRQRPDFANRQRTSNRNSHEKHKDQRNKQKRDKYANDPEYAERIRRQTRRSYSDNPQPQREYQALKRRTRPRGFYKVIDQRREARKRGLPNELTDEEWQRALDYFDGKCAVCGRRPDFWTTLAADHWIPLSNQSPDNPGSVATNIVPLCHKYRKGSPVEQPCCNISKKDRVALDWLVERFGNKRANMIMKRIEQYFKWVRERENGT